MTKTAIISKDYYIAPEVQSFNANEAIGICQTSPGPGENEGVGDYDWDLSIQQ